MILLTASIFDTKNIVLLAFALLPIQNNAFREAQEQIYLPQMQNPRTIYHPYHVMRVDGLTRAEDSGTHAKLSAFFLCPCG